MTNGSGRGHGREEAEDLVQGVFEHLLVTGAVGKADPARGRFRSYLLGCLQHFLANDRQRRSALKRGGGVIMKGVEVEEAERWLARQPSGDASPDRVYDRQWALAVLGEGLQRLKSEFAGGARKSSSRSCGCIYRTRDPRRGMRRRRSG